MGNYGRLCIVALILKHENVFGSFFWHSCFFRCSHSPLHISCRIANISMEIAVKFEEMHLGRPLAHLVEQCRCPAGYTGLSCQVLNP